MGTARDWMWVGCYVSVVWGFEYLVYVFFGTGGFLPSTRNKVAFVVSGLFAGIVLVFNARLLHSPLAFIVVALAITLFFAGSRWPSLRQWYEQSKP